MLTLQERMLMALKHSGKKPSALARYLGISESAISQWVNGPTKSVNSILVIKAAHFLGVSAYWFSTGEGNMLSDGGGEVFAGRLNMGISADIYTRYPTNRLIKINY